MTISVQSDAVDVVLGRRQVEPLFQPVVDLERGCVVGYEALARGSAGPLTTPQELFGAARAAGRLVELDWLCRERAVEQARAAGLRHPLSLFVNAEPEALLASKADADRWRSFGDLRCYAELTERALAARPAALLRAVDQVREQDWGIALDDVGAKPDSMALLPILRPDVIKLDLRLLHSRPTSDGDVAVASTVHAVMDHAGRTGAVVIAEGIETERHLDLAHAYGAQYGQGYALGRPAPLPSSLVSPSVAVPLLPRVLDRKIPPSPFAVVSDSCPTRPAGRQAVREVARQLLAQADAMVTEPVVLICSNDPDLLGDSGVRLVHSLSRRCLTAVVGTEDVTALLARVRAGTLAHDDPATDDFDVIVIGAHYSAALVSRRCLPLGPDGRYDVALTFDPTLVAAAASALLRRVDELGR